MYSNRQLALTASVLISLVLGATWLFFRAPQDPLEERSYVLRYQRAFVRSEYYRQAIHQARWESRPDSKAYRILDEALKH